jgi:GNAT superfamily N-acetyltransferase
MRIRLTPFDPGRHLTAAATLLADRHRRDRVRDPRLPVSFEDPEACRGQLEHTLESSSGWQGMLAEVDGEPVGFGIMTPQFTEPTHLLANFFPPRSASFPYHCFAAHEGLEYDVYREVYGTLADGFVRNGIFDHAVSLPATDAATVDAFNSLGFGRTLACAIRGVEPVERPAAEIDVHQASAEDYPVVEALGEELTLHHTRSPIFNPFIRESDEASHSFVKGLLQDPAENAHWIGYDGKRPLGMNTFMQPFFLSPLTVPEKTIYLFLGVVTEDARTGGVGSAILSRSVAWAREKGYENVALHFATANISGARFWQSSGFRPVEYAMRRHVDERIAWANK